LFVLLLCRRNGGTTTEELLDILWPDGEAPPRRDAIHNNVYRVRKALYRNCVVLENGHYGINRTDPVWFDLDEFQVLSDAASVETYSPRKLELLERAIDIYQGEFLSGFYSDWILEVRRQAESRFITDLLSLASSQIDLGRIPDARTTLSRIERVDPGNEAALRMSSAISNVAP
jgi:two-component SAPR family response regulator